MCGIYASNCLNCVDKDTITKMKQNQRLLNHRGPDCYYTVEKNNIFLAHHRLAIIDISNEANQPFNHQDKYYLTINGEIYNYKDLIKTNNYQCKSNSDCEVVLHHYINKVSDNSNQLTDNEYNQKIVKFINDLDGIFSFVIYDVENDSMLIVRDRFGVTSLYYGFDKEGYLHISSEIKAFTDNYIKPQMFPAGCFSFYNGSNFSICQYYNLSEHYDLSTLDTLNKGNYQSLKESLKNDLIMAVLKRLQSNVPFATLLSGGLDSSLITSIAVKLLRRELDDKYNVIMDNLGIKKMQNIHTFSIGFEGSPDLKAAKTIADYLGTNHESITITLNEALLAVRDVMWHLETYDVTTIRASTPMYLLSRKIKANGFKMVLSGEGSDELFGGYLYFHKAPSNKEFVQECAKRMNELQYFDNLRANKSTLAFGLEGRFPFLDTNVVNNYISLGKDVNIHNGMEKFILRDAFSKGNYLPEKLLWRRKEQFSDGVGYQWIDKLKEIANEQVTDLMMENAKYYFDFNVPKTKEEYYYREMFKEIFKHDQQFDRCVKKWIPNELWSGVGYDPSGRAQTAHQSNSDWKN